MLPTTTEFKIKFTEHFPEILTKPLQLIPAVIQKPVFTKILQRVFYDAIESGDLDFLQGFYLKFEIEDCKLSWTYTFNGQTMQLTNDNPADASIRCILRIEY